jgi:hypothetical protein
MWTEPENANRSRGDLKKMAKFTAGEAVAVPATVQEGPFPGEYLVTVSTMTGAVSGFARDQDMVAPGKTIHGVVRESTQDVLSIQLSGSYFTTNGLAEFAIGWANQNVKAIA